MDQPTAEPTDEAPATESRMDLLLEARPIDGPSKGLVWIKTPDWLPWLVVLVAFGLLVGIAAARYQAGVAALKVEVWGSLVVLLIAAAICWHKLGSAKQYHKKFVFSNPEDVVGFVHFDEAGIRFGTPKLHQTQYAWVYFSNYAFTADRLRLVAGGLRLVIDLSRASESQRAELRAGLARVFARPRVGPPIHIRHCMGCGYDLSASPGPDCPECGHKMHKLNFPGTRTTDLSPKDLKPE